MATITFFFIQFAFLICRDIVNFHEVPMDNTTLSLILTALSTGAVVGFKDTATQAVKDGYEKLKELIQKKLAGTPSALVALTEHEKHPEIWKAPLEEGLKATGADQDEEVISAAQQLLSLVHPQQAMMMGKYNIQTMGNVQNQIVGDHPTITFNNSKE
jgi:hypothetical protein